MICEWQDAYGIRVLNVDSGQRVAIPECLSAKAACEARAFHRQLNEYRETPLVSLHGLAETLGVKAIYAKDESRRFSLNAFKGLGGSYAMFRILCEELVLDTEKTTLSDLRSGDTRKKIEDMVFVTATDGNHGRGVSWAGGLFGCKVRVFMPKGSVEARAEAIRRVGPAEVTITDMNYDETVRYAMKMSEKNHWHLIQDTAWDGYEKIPSWIIQGYLTMASEAKEQLEKAGAMPTHIFLQAGVGAMAGGVLGYFASVYGANKPVTAIVEPDTVNCIYQSAKAADGTMHSITGDPITIMAGLNCGTPCKVTWPVLRDYAEFYIACPDYVAAHGMRLYAEGEERDEKIISGESGAATLGAVSLILTRPEFAETRRAMNLTENSVILLFNTEGNTDPEGYNDIVNNGFYPLPKEG